FLRNRAKFFDGRISGDSGTHISTGKCCRNRIIIEQIAWMRHQHVSCIAAIDLNADLTRLEAKMLVATRAKSTLAAADPRIDNDTAARFRVLGFGAGRFDRAFDLMSEREGKRTSAGEFKFSPAAEIEISLMQMNVGVANAAMPDADEDFAAHGHRHLADCFAKRNTVIGKYPLLHFVHDGPWVFFSFPTLASTLASATNPATGISSARRVGSMPARSRMGIGSTLSTRRLDRNIFRRCPNAAAVTRSNVARSQERGAARGTSRTTEEVTFGGGTKALRFISNRIFPSVRQPVSTLSRPY